MLPKLPLVIFPEGLLKFVLLKNSAHNRNETPSLICVDLLSPG